MRDLLSEIFDAFDEKKEEKIKDSNIFIESFKIKKDKVEDFKKLFNSDTSIRFHGNPEENIDYISFTFEIKDEEYQEMLDLCINKNIYYYC